jgi:hypothetical protein
MENSIFHRALKRLDKTISGPISLFPDQFIYGNREILIAYAGMDHRSIFKATFEHGWDIRSSKPITKSLGKQYPHFSWSNQRISRTMIQNSGLTAIGSPFIYLVSMLKQSIERAAENQILDLNEIVFFPLHGNEFEFQNTESQIELFKAGYDTNETTVCLYWAEYINPRIIQLYKQAGFKKIVTAGFSGQVENTGLGYSARNLAASPMGGRNLFYLQLISYLVKHQKVIVGGFGSICFYAAYLNKEIEVLKNHNQNTILALNSKFKSWIETYNREQQNFLETNLHTSFANINYSSASFRELASIELGAQCLKSSSDLQNILNGCSTLGASSTSSEETSHAILNFYDTFLSIN